MTAALEDGDFTGSRRAFTRVTIQQVQMGTYPVGEQVYSSIVFPGVAQAAIELPNLKSLSWERSVDDAIATCNFELWNTEPLPPGTKPATGDVFDQIGYYTYNRGKTAFSRLRWGHTPNVWQDYLTPDRVVRVYQGYGVDYSVIPERDPHMVLMGCFLTDEVTYTADGLITVNCRDYGRMLLEQIMFPPVVPLSRYPLEFEHNHEVQDPPIITTTSSGGTSWERMTYDTDSNVPYIGRNGNQYGHHGSDAFDGSTGSYWLSIGNLRPTQGYSFEHIQGRFPKARVSQARAQVWGGPYTWYLSVRKDGVWQGNAVIPYDPNNPASAPNGSNIRFIQSGRVGRDGTISCSFPEMAGVDAIRFTMTDLFNSGLGSKPYRAGVRDMQYVRNTFETRTVTTIPPKRWQGNFEDFTDIVKLLLAYGGFYWTPEGKMTLTARQEDPGRVHIKYIKFGTVNVTRTLKRWFHGKQFTYRVADNDPILGVGRVWGDLMTTQAPERGIIYDIGLEVFDKKPIMDGIQHIKDLLGMVFFIDEQGAAQWRLPNLFTLGNWRSDVNGLNQRRVGEIQFLTDDDVILDLRSTLSSRNLREMVLVGSLAGKIGAAGKGRFNGLPQAGMRRLAIWTDQGFGNSTDGLKAQQQAQVMADMIALRQLFTYRQNTVRLPADPRIQVDDQIRVRERTTGEDYHHYVNSISSEWNLEQGTWTYDLTTHWLGADPQAEWAFTTTDLSAEAQAFIEGIGQ